MSEGGTAEVGQGSSSNPSNHLPWHLIPIFDPGATDLTEYNRRLEFLAGIWPQEQLSQLAPRAALQCKGSAFQKVVRIAPEKLKVPSVEGVKLLVTTLGGVWGKTTLEDRFEKFEKAIFGLSQRPDESNESYVARHDILFEDLVTQGISFKDVRAYILLRNSALSAEDKKRVLVESKGELQYETVTSAIRMLGAKFFQEVQGQAKQHRSKTYEVNHVQESEEDAYGTDDGFFTFSTEGSDLPDAVIDHLLSEGGEDALVVQQFEDALIEAVQNDGEMSTYMSAYLDARRRLTEKSRSRGFWPIRPKGAGKKGKGKFPFTRGRKPLAVRIAESDCRLCGQRGHWKSECPKRGQINSNATAASKAQPTNVLMSVTEMPNDESDVFVMTHDSLPASAVHPSAQDHEFMPSLSHSQNILVCWGSGSVRKKGEFFSKVKERLRIVCRNLPVPPTDRMPMPERSHANPSPEKMIPKENLLPETFVGPAACERTEVMEPQSIAYCPTKSVAHDVMFATSHNLGILDLGASQTVMGSYQVPEFLKSLPPSVRKQVYEQTVEMTFRFGNNGVVPCHRALMVPVDRFWIKIAVVESRTPFLISNNVCRSLGAVIDTTNQTIFFRELNCTLPLTLSGKKLFLLEFSELVAQRPPQPSVAVKPEGPRAENVCTCVDQSTECPGHCSAVTCSQNVPEKQETENQKTVTGSLRDSTDNGQLDSPWSSHVTMQSTHDPKQRPQKPSETANTCSVPANVSNSHVQPCRTFCSHADFPDQGDSGKGIAEAQLRPAQGDAHPVRISQDRSELSDSGEGRSEILHVVSPPIWQQSEAGAPRIPSIPGVVDRTSRTGTELDGTPRKDRSSSHGQQTQSQGQEWRGTWEVFRTSHDDRLGRGRGGTLGHCISSGKPDHRRAGEPAIESIRTCSLAGSGADATAAASSSRRSIRLMDPAQNLMIERSIHELNTFMEHHGLGRSAKLKQENHVSNWVYDELEQYSARHGSSVRRPSSKLDVLEIYCSSESELTRQCQQQGLRSIRFGLREGDLGTFEGRQKLYHTIITLQPKHIWMSPRCKAWCKWNQFNASRSQEAARRVMQSREDDLVHLLLCAAMFQWQQSCGPEYHFHLEQPVGSDMLFQECLQEIIDASLRVRCDMCTAGKLAHPISSKLLQKGTQILTTSSILARYVETLRCNHQHEHDQVAGSFVLKDGSRRNVSEFSELYTRTFCIRIARTIKASLQVLERSVAQSMPVFGTLDKQSESEVKRRRLSGKVSEPPGYPPAAGQILSGPQHEQRLSLKSDDPQFFEDPTILANAKEIAPKVGTLVLEKGPLFDRIQEACTNHVIRVLEICKGADRFRQSPIRLMPHEAPLRLTFGLLRQGLEPFNTGTWQPWEHLSVRKICAKAPAARLMITVFARPSATAKREVPSGVSDLPTKKIRLASEGDQMEPLAKNAHESQQEVPIEGLPTDSQNEDSVNPHSSTLDQLQNSVIQHGPRFLALPSKTRQWLSKIHHNLGHPGINKLQNVLKQQGFDDAIVQGAGDFKCSTCVETQAPRVSRPASLSEPRGSMTVLDAT